MDNPYQAPSAPLTDPAGGAARPHKLGLFLSLFMTCVPALILSIAVPQFREVFSTFGPELPWLTLIVVKGYLATWLLPVSVVAVWFGWPSLKQRSFIVFAIGLVSVMLTPFCIIALYLPIFKLGTVV